jgi:hypothetical protein
MADAAVKPQSAWDARQAQREQEEVDQLTAFRTGAMFSMNAGGANVQGPPAVNWSTTASAWDRRQARREQEEIDQLTAFSKLYDADNPQKGT